MMTELTDPPLRFLFGEDQTGRPHLITRDIAEQFDLMPITDVDVVGRVRFALGADAYAVGAGPDGAYTLATLDVPALGPVEVGEPGTPLPGMVAICRFDDPGRGILASVTIDGMWVLINRKHTTECDGRHGQKRCPATASHDTIETIRGYVTAARAAHETATAKREAALTSPLFVLPTPGYRS